MLRIVAAVSALAGVVVLAIAVAATLDAAIRFPWFVRAAMLAGIVAFIVLDVRAIVLPALRFRPTTVELALRIERMRPELAGRLASAIEFDVTGQRIASELASRAVTDAEERAVGADLGRVLRYRPALLRLGAMFIVILGAALFALLDSNSASIAAQRVLWPWGGAAWPSRTGVESLVADGLVAARGRPLALRARLTSGDPEKERVRVEYRVVRNDSSSVSATSDSPDWIEAILARQPSGDFERLVDTGGSVEGGAFEERIEFRFRTSDALTEIATIRLVEPPAISDSTMRIIAPEYASRVITPRIEAVGDGTDPRSILRDPVLEGSSVSLELRFTRSLPFDEAHSKIRVENARSDSELLDSQIVIDPHDPTRSTVSCIARGPTRISVELVDADGIAQDEPLVFSFDTIEDRAPSASIVEPLQDESVVSDAKVEMRADARDDLELRAAGIEIATRLGKSAAESLVFEEPSDIATGSAVRVAIEIERTLDVAKLALEPGDSVVLRGYSEDFFVSGSEPTTHGRVRSASRTLRIVGEEEFERQIRSTLAGVRRDAMRIDERQAKARDMVERDAANPTAAETQGAVTEGLSRARDSIEQALARLSRNKREDGVLGELARQAAELADAAQAKSSEASTAIEQAREAATSAGDPEQLKLEKDRASTVAAARQDDVREELEDLVGLLDRDEDAWIARRRIDALVNRVRQLSRETDQAARRSNGESRDELSPEARAELDTLADKQAQAADDAEQVSSELRERAKELAAADSPQAKALEEAAQAVEEGRVREELESAAKDAESNRLEQSKSAQDRAAAALAKAAEALNQDRKVRAEELARVLESLADSIRRLLNEAEALGGEVAVVATGSDDASDVARDTLARPVGLLSQNTRGLASDARSASREAARIAKTLDDAAASLASVTGFLRTEQFERDDASSAMDAAIKFLSDALVSAEEAADRAEERAEEEKREELLVKYRDLLERQAAVRGAVSKIIPEANKLLGRREIVESRRLGTVQEELRAAIEAIRTSETDVQASDALVEMHDIINVALIDAKARLSEGKPADAMPPEDEAVDALSAIVSALDDSSAPKDDDAFGEQESPQGEGGGGGGGPQGGAVPPVAEIKILRSLQDSLAKRTRQLAERMESLDGVSRAQQVAELAAKQQRIVELGTRIAEKLSAGSGPDVSQPSGTPAPAEPAPETPKNEDVGEQPRSTEESDRKEVKP